jgi:DNA polymerase I-like protein with 3'-5' exonuclease and polymerase domains
VLSQKENQEMPHQKYTVSSMDQKLNYQLFAKLNWPHKNYKLSLSKSTDLLGDGKSLEEILKRKEFILLCLSWMLLNSLNSTKKSFLKLKLKKMKWAEMTPPKNQKN